MVPAVIHAVPTSVSTAVHENQNEGTTRKKRRSQHNNKLMFNVTPGKFIALSVRSKIAKNVNGHKSTSKLIAIRGWKKEATHTHTKRQTIFANNGI